MSRMLVITLRTVTFRAAWTLVLAMHDLVGGRALRGEALVQPVQGGNGGRILLAQSLHELHGEAAGQRAAIEAGQRGGRVGRDSPADPEQPVGDLVGALPIRASR